MSKYRLIGALRTLFKTSLWIFLAAYHPDVSKIKLLQNVKKELIKA